MGLETTIKRHKLVAAYLAFGGIWGFIQAQKANAAYANDSSSSNANAYPEAWGGFGQQNSRINSIIQNILFWPYALIAGDAAANDPTSTNNGNTMLASGQSWSTS